MYSKPASMVGKLAESMGVELLEASPQRVVGTMPVAGNEQPFGLLHGGASCVLGETLGSIGASLHAAPGGYALGIELNASHHKALRSGSVKGVATPLRLGRALATYQILINDEAGDLVCTLRLTCLIRPARRADRLG